MEREVINREELNEKVEKNLSRKKELNEISEELMECWYFYGLFYGVETSDIINNLDGRMKKLYDAWEVIKDGK